MISPKILGILNITSDSFSDGGLFLQTDKAIAHASELLESGADIIDVGAASSNPNTNPVSTQEEIARLKPVISFLKEKKSAISVDTFNPEVQRFCMQQDVDYLNDIQGFPYSEIYPELAASNCKLIIMHSVQRIGAATIVETNPREVFDSMIIFFQKRIKDLIIAGIPKERLILDPGMGHFLGSNPDSSIFILKNIEKIKSEFNLPVLIGVSRKSFLGNITGNPNPKDRGAATLATELYTAQHGADYIRTHDVRALNDGLKVLENLT